MKKMFNFEKQLGWSEVIAFIALALAGLSFYLQVLSNRAEVSLINDKLISANFIDKDGKKKFFGFYRALIINNGNKPVTLIGLKPYENSGIILTSEHGSSKLAKDGISYKIFQMQDTLVSDRLFSKEENLRNFENQGLERLSLINRVINPGEVYFLSIGTVFDLYSDTTKSYSSMIFTSQLHFSNGQKFSFGAGGNLDANK